MDYRSAVALLIMVVMSLTSCSNLPASITLPAGPGHDNAIFKGRYFYRGWGQVPLGREQHEIGVIVANGDGTFSQRTYQNDWGDFCELASVGTYNLDAGFGTIEFTWHTVHGDCGSQVGQQAALVVSDDGEKASVTGLDRDSTWVLELTRMGEEDKQ